MLTASEVPMLIVDFSHLKSVLMLFFLKKSDDATLNSSNSDVPDGAADRLKERSISPDSIESVSDMESRGNNNFCDENPISNTSTADVLCTDSAEHSISPALNQSFLLSASQDLGLQTLEETPANDSLLRLCFEDQVSSKILSNSWNCYSKLRLNQAETFRSLSFEKHIYLDDPIGSRAAAKDLDDKLINRNSRTDQNSEYVIHSGKDLTATLKPTEELSSQHIAGAVGSLQCQASFPVGPCIGVFSCDEISVFCQKLYFENILQLTLTFFHSDTSGFANASVSIVSSSAQFLNPKVFYFQNF